MKHTLLLRRAGEGAPIEVAIERNPRDASDAFTVQVGDRRFDARVLHDQGGAGRLVVDGRVVPFYAAVEHDAIEVWVDGKTYRIETVAGRHAAARGEAHAAPGDVTSPMPGTVLKIHVRPGDRVTAHQPLIVLESMKMEMTLSAPGDGVIASIECAEGQLVQMGQILVRLREPSDVGGTA